MRETWRIYRQPDLAYGWVVWRYGRGARGAPMRRESAATGGAGIAQTRSFCFTFALPRAVVHRTDPVRGDVDQPSRPGGYWIVLLLAILHVVRFSPGQVSEEQRMGQARGHAFNTEGLIIERLPDGLLWHGLPGFGSADFVGQGGVGDTFEVRNVRRANSQ